ncbi:unnamed protein product [Dibothriocephalus latus]|uniref:Uncharacterized protein n=1 Tax=Dibothriocephalus latus TaxID=60516 RepID=A0A3P7LR96_DIBLA|nr:unnamed protein product [Dibothriocephalus latus]
MKVAMEAISSHLLTATAVVGNITSVRQGDFTLLPACELPAVTDYKSRGWNWTHNDMQILSPSQFIIPHRHNGSLTVQAQLADFNSTYQCEAYVVLANETVVKGETKVHFIIPIVAAFLTNPPTNRSIRWGAYYTFPCDAGGTDVVLERRLNGQVCFSSALPFPPSLSFSRSISTVLIDSHLYGGGNCGLKVRRLKLLAAV